MSHRYHNIFYKEISSNKTKNAQCDIYIENLRLYLEDIKIVDKVSLFYLSALKEILYFKFKEQGIVTYSDEYKIELSNKLNIYLNNFEAVVNARDPINNVIYNTLNLNIDLFAMSTEENKLVNKMQLSLYQLTFGFNYSEQFDYPLISLPFCECNIDKQTNYFRLNVPSNYLRKIKNLSRNNKTREYKNELDKHIFETKSLTLFFNFQYLNTFYKIFENLWKRSDFIKKYFIDSNVKVNDTASDHNAKPDKVVASLSLPFEPIGEKKELEHKSTLLLSLFDLKIIYLVQYKEEYSKVFQFHEDIRTNGYFGYIIRLYSVSLKHVTFVNNIDELILNASLFTISLLNKENFNDDIFFQYDKDIKYSKFFNLKSLKNFNEYMEISKTNKRKMINTNFLKFFEVEENNIDDVFNNKEYCDLIFDKKHTVIKIFELNFKRDTMSLNNIEDIYIKIKDIKITWNKINMDIMGILIFKDVLLIVDKIILKLNKNKNNNLVNPNNNNDGQIIIENNVLDLGKFNFVFELDSPQICIENELKNSKVLLTTKENCSAKISKICVNESSKDFKLEISINMMALYISPNFLESKYIHWIGDSNESKYYLNESNFNTMLETPIISFHILENIQRKQGTKNEFDHYTNTSIHVDKIQGFFEKDYFKHFMNIIEVFIFDRGYSYAEEKINIDSRVKDMEMFSTHEIKKMIKSSLAPFISNKKKKHKEITFQLNVVTLTLSKEDKEIIKMLMKKFEGEHIIYMDKSTDTKINVKDLKILDLIKNKNMTILSPNFEVQKIDDFEDKRNLLEYRRKDSYVSSKYFIKNSWNSIKVVCT
jgi:hypothetical protein